MGNTEEFTGRPDDITLHEVKSNFIKAIGYDPDSKILRVEFKTGNVWDYFDIESSFYEELKIADSIGAFFHQFIKDKVRGSQVL